MHLPDTARAYNADIQPLLAVCICERFQTLGRQVQRHVRAAHARRCCAASCERAAVLGAQPRACGRAERKGGRGHGGHGGGAGAMGGDGRAVRWAGMGRAIDRKRTSRERVLARAQLPYRALSRAPINLATTHAHGASSRIVNACFAHVCNAQPKSHTYRVHVVPFAAPLQACAAMGG
eukprot:IDg10575t1